MSLSTGFPPIPNSITNSDVSKENVIDENSPISYAKFQSIVGYYQPNVKDYYTEYLNKWNDTKKSSSNLEKIEILDRYKNFIKELAITYATIEEKEFFENLDYDDPRQLEISIPFFTEKIKTISKYYKNKREDLKFQTIKNKSVGIDIDLKNKIKDFTINFIENLPQSDIKYEVDYIRENLSVEIEELFDSYPLYFDQTPDSKIYDYKDLDYGLDIFLRTDDDLINEIFSDVSEEIKNLKEVAGLFDLKRKETVKNVSTNFYYISTGDTPTQFLSGLLFENTNSIGNFYNKNYPTTASTPKSVLESNKQRGFFTPQKTGILLLDGERKSFTINVDKLKKNTLYYFPDPMLTNGEEFLSFVIDEKYLTKNQTTGKADLEPKINKNDTTFHGYVSEKYIDQGQKHLQALFNEGYVKDLKKDAYGNIYGLFSNDNNFKIGFKAESDTVVKQLILNGHTFYDNLYGEGFSFDYSLEDANENFCTYRSGLSANTGNFTELSGYYTLFGRYFTPYEEISDPCLVKTSYVYYDGGFLGNVVDTMSSDLSSFPGNSAYYYDVLLEGGIRNNSPIERALLFPDYLTDELGNILLTESDIPFFEGYDETYYGNLLLDFIPDETNTFLIDGGLLTDSFEYDYSFTSPGYAYRNEVYCDSVFEVDSFETLSYLERQNLDGKLFVKNSSNGDIAPINTNINYLSSILPSDVLISMESNTKRFEVVNDVLIVETDAYLIAFKIGFENGNFINPKKSPLVKSINTNPFNKVSKRFYTKENVYYTTFDNLNYPLSSNALDLMMVIYELNSNDLVEKTIESDIIHLSGGDIIYDHIDLPVVAYNDTLKTFNISTLLKDQNHLFDILDISYQIKPYSLKHLKLHENQSESFSNINTSTITILSSANTSNLNPYLIVA
jgi:hypothetical protein